MRVRLRFPNILHLVPIIILVGIVPAASARQSQDREEAPKIIRKSGGVLQSSAVKRVEPSYSPLAKAARISGTVVVEVTLDEGGNVIAARAISGHPLLKDSAVSAAKAWEFKPTLLQGVAVKVIGTITFNFHIDHTEDIEALRKKVAEDPNSAELHADLAEMLRIDSRFEEAIAEFSRALELGGESTVVLFQFGETYNAMGKVSESIEKYQKALNLNTDPEFVALIQMRLGEAFVRQGNNEEALTTFKQVIVARPEWADAHFNLGSVYLKLGDRQSAQSEFRILKNLNEELAERLGAAIQKSN